jgi:hypothetical protein
MSNLTKEQEIEIENFYQQSMKEALSTDETDVKKIESAINTVYEYCGLTPPKHIIKVVSPQKAIELFLSQNEGCHQEAKDGIILLSMFSFWVLYYYAGVTILGEKIGGSDEEKLLNVLKACYELHKHCHAFHPCENACIVIERPKKICLQDDDIEKFVLSNTDGHAIEYRDGTGACAINNILVPDYIALTPASELDIVRVLSEADIDVRREGLAKILSSDSSSLLKISKVIDSQKGKEAWDNYELLDVNFGDDKKRICLKMFDVASGKFCVERVSDNCVSVFQALAFRDDEEKYVQCLLQT